MIETVIIIILLLLLLLLLLYSCHALPVHLVSMVIVSIRGLYRVERKCGYYIKHYIIHYIM